MQKVVSFFLKHKRFGLLSVLMFSLWGFVSSLILYHLPLSSLQRHYGQVEFIKPKLFDCRSGKFSKGLCARTDIKLVNKSPVFRVRTSVNDGGLIGGINAGDTVTIYTLHWYQYPLSFGFFHGISQLEKGEEVLYEFNWIKEQSPSKMTVYGIIFAVFLIFLFLEWHTVKILRGKK